jgi:hypothetical protein
LPGRIGDPGDGHVPAAASSSAAAAGAGTRLICSKNWEGGRDVHPPFSGCV